MTDDVKLYDLSGHPDYSSVAGRIFAVWSTIEFRLCNLYALLMRSPPWLAQSAYYAIINSNARIDMVRTLAAQLTEQNPDRQPILDIIVEVSDAPLSRHGYAHKPWLLYKDKVYQMDRIAPHLNHAKKHHVSLTQMKRDLQNLQKLDKKLTRLTKGYSKRNPISFRATEEDLSWLGKLPRRTENQNP